MSAPSEPSALQRLTRPQFWGFYAVAVAIFVFSTGPVWRHPWSMDLFNMAVLYSYLPLPPMVAIGLFYKRRFSLRAFFLDTLDLTLLKYATTFGISLVLWSLVPAPAPAAARAPRPPAQEEAAEPLPAPTPIAPERTGSIEGVVVSHEGRPLEEALVHVESGLEGYVFAPPEAPLSLENDGSGVRPRLAAAHVHQAVLARSTDGHLHTLVAKRDGAALFNTPLLGSGAPSRLRIAGAAGIASLSCAVHQGAESPAHLAIFTHPFFAITGKDGRFAFKGVPAGTLRIAAWSGGAVTSKEIRLDPQGAGRLDLTLGAR
jgi:hypothetical protein